MPLLTPPLRVRCCLPLAVFLLPLLAAAAPGWRAGVGREDITPREPLWMTGYAARDRPADGTAQKLWVKALAFEDPAGQRGVLLTADLCAINRALSDRIAAELERRYHLPRSALLTNVSHTHCAPALPDSLPGIRLLPPNGAERAARYARELETRMLRAATSALDSLAPATIDWSEDEATFGMNRRNNTEAEAPARRAAGTLRGPADPRVPVLAVRTATGELRALVVSYACHNTTLMLYQWHGDYAGCAQEELERRHAGATVLFAQGCGADINPNPRRELPQAALHGRALADAADRALAKPPRPLTGGFRSAFAEITLSFARRPTEAQIREAREKDQPNKEMHQAWAEAVATRLRTLGDEGAMKYTYPIQAWRLGNLSWVALGGEVVVDYALRLRRELGDDLWVLGYSTDVMAYIPNERVLQEGRYEGETSMIPYGLPGPWSPGLENRIVDQARELVARTK